MNLRIKTKKKGRLMKKLLAFITAVVLVLGCAVPAFAKNLVKPTYHTSENVSHPGITSVTIGGEAAYYEQDSNTDSTVYIRKVFSNSSKTEYELKSTAVVITTTGYGVTVKYGNNTISGSQVGYTYSYTLDLFNKSYSVIVNNIYYILAAGIDDGVVGIHDDDPLKISGTLATNVSLDVYGSCQNNPYMGNPYYSGGWTFINYFFAGTLPANMSLSMVSGSFTLPTGTALSGAGVTNYSSGTTANFNFTSGNYLTITNSGASRIYYPRLSITGDYIVISQSNYDFDFTELKTSGSSIYTSTIEEKVEAIERAWNAYLAQNSDDLTFSSGATAMNVLEDFIYWAGTNYYNNNTLYFTGTSNTNGGTYLSCLNGLDASDCGNMSGYMYAIEPYYWEDENDHCTLATVGADAYVLTNSTYVVWFYTVDYTNWINW